MKSEYKNVRDIIVDFGLIFNVVPTGETFTTSLWHDAYGNPRNYSFDEKGNPTHDPKISIEKQSNIEGQYYRSAITIEDFKTVFETQFLKQNKTDKRIFRDRQIEIFTAKRKALDSFVLPDQEYTAIVGLPKEYIPKPHKVDLEYFIDLVDRYINFLKEIKISEANELQIESKTTIIIPTQNDNSKKKEYAENQLRVLAGKWLNGENIMAEEDYKTVVEGVFYLIEFDKVKPISQKIKIGATKQFIRRLFWQLHNDLFTTKRIKESFLEFLKVYFVCFDDTGKSDIKKHFKEYLNGDFDQHYNQVLASIKNK